MGVANDISNQKYTIDSKLTSFYNIYSPQKPHKCKYNIINVAKILTITL